MTTRLEAVIQKCTLIISCGLASKVVVIAGLDEVNACINMTYADIIIVIEVC